MVVVVVVDFSLSLSLSLSLSQSDRWYYIDDGPLFDSLSSCMDHYMMFADGLPTILRYPIDPIQTRIVRFVKKLVCSDFIDPLFTYMAILSIHYTIIYLLICPF